MIATISVATLFALTPTLAFASGDKNCSDFKTWQEAQSYFESHGGSSSNNVDGLDRDHDGLACESLKGFKPGHKNPHDRPATPPKEEPTPIPNPKPEPKPMPLPKPVPVPEPKPAPTPSDNTKQPGGNLPKTANGFANSMVLGSIMLLAGVFMLRKKPTT